jgi:HlyD family secretion protein
VDIRDICFVREEQEVKLKLTTCTFQKYGMDGTVRQVSADASEQGAGSGTARGELPSSGEAKFRAIVALAAQGLENGARRHSLAPGMQVQAEIKLGRRTVLEYLLSPVQRAWQEAGRER